MFILLYLRTWMAQVIETPPCGNQISVFPAFPYCIRWYCFPWFQQSDFDTQMLPCSVQNFKPIWQLKWILGTNANLWYLGWSSMRYQHPQFPFTIVVLQWCTSCLSLKTTARYGITSTGIDADASKGETSPGYFKSKLVYCYKCGILLILIAARTTTFLHRTVYEGGR